MLAIVAVNVIVASPVPVPLLKVSPVVPPRVSAPLVAVSVSWSGSPACSAAEIWLPLPEEKTRGVLALVDWGPGTVLTGVVESTDSATAAFEVSESLRFL